MEANLKSVTHHTLERAAQGYLLKDDLCEASMVRAIRFAIQRHASRAENKRLLGLVRANEALLQRKNQQLRKLYDTDRDFIDNVSYEFRMPLTVVKEYVALIRKGTLGQVKNKQARILRTAEDRADDLNVMVDGMLDISKLDAGFLATHRHPNEFHDIRRRIFPSVQGKAEIKQLALSFDIEPGFSAVFRDSEKIQRVLIILVVNAMKYTPPAGRVHIWARSRSKELLVGVSDNGSGIAAENQETISERFEQGKVDVCSSTKGFGLGLSIANELVELNLGQMSVKSDLGEATTFTFTAPKNESIEVAQHFLCLPDREDLRFLSILSCEVDAVLFNGAADEIEGFLRHLIRGNYLCLAISLQTWLILIPAPISEAELFINRAQRECEHANANRPLGPLSSIDFKSEKSWVDQTKHQSKIRQYLHGNAGEPMFFSVVASLPADQMALEELNQ